VVPQHFLVASLVAARPMIILLEACHAGFAAALRGHTVLPIVRARHLVAVPHLLSLLLENPLVIVPLHFLIASLVAARPMFILLEAEVPGFAAALRVHTIGSILGACGLRRDLVAIPHLLSLLLEPLILVVPQHFLIASLVAARPMFILLEAGHAGFAAALGREAILPICCACGCWRWRWG